MISKDTDTRDIWMQKENRARDTGTGEDRRDGRDIGTELPRYRRTGEADTRDTGTLGDRRGL